MNRVDEHAFDAMTANRVYRKQLDFDYVLSELKRCRGTQFDPQMLDILLKLIEDGKIDVEALYNKTKSGNISESLSKDSEKESENADDDEEASKDLNGAKEEQKDLDGKGVIEKKKNETGKRKKNKKGGGRK